LWGTFKGEAELRSKTVHRGSMGSCSATGSSGAEPGRRHGLQIMLDAVRLAWRYNPTVVVFALGSVPLLPGVPILLWVFYEYVFRRVEHFVWAIISLQLVSVGFVSMLLAIVSLYLKRMEYRLTERIEKAVRQRPK